MLHTLNETAIDYKGRFNKNSLLKTAEILTHYLYSIIPSIHQLLKSILILLIPLPLLMLVAGTEGLIEQESPDNLASLSSIGSGFFNFLEMHSLILLGAFGVTFIIWLLTRNLWLNTDDEDISE